MSRLRRFVHGVASSYVSMAAMIVTSLLTVPLALHYLSKENFGLWSLLTTIVSYFMLIDFGMTASVARLLIERKDQQDNGGYARLVNSSFLVGFIQGLIIAVIGAALAPWLAILNKIPPEAHAAFCGLVQWQSFIVAASFVIRPFRNLLVAHQRSDVVNYTQAVGFPFGIVILAVSLRAGHGVFAILWSNAAVFIFTAIANWWACLHLRLFPKTSIGPRFAWQEFNELFSYGRDVFIVQIGSLLIVATQPTIISRALGLEAVATWSVGSKAFFMLSNVIWQIFDLSTPAFSEMMVRGECERLRKRFHEITALSLALTMAAAVIYATLNTSFVAAWTHGKIHWSLGNDILLALWMIVSTLVHANSGFIVITKEIRGMRYVYLLEGAAFVLISSYLAHRFGIAGVIATSIICSVIFSGAYGIQRINDYFAGFFKADKDWLRPLAKLFLFTAPVAIAYYWFSRGIQPMVRFIAGGIVLTSIASVLMLRYGVPFSLRPDLLRRMPSWLRRDAEKWASLLKQTP